MTIVIETGEEELEKTNSNFGRVISYITANHPSEFSW